MINHLVRYVTDANTWPRQQVSIRKVGVLMPRCEGAWVGINVSCYDQSACIYALLLLDLAQITFRYFRYLPCSACLGLQGGT